MADRKLTILHANDLHGKLAFSLKKDFSLYGGISLTSGYIKKVREEEENVFFGICGDVLQEDILGSDYKGTNTVNLINYLHPDAISLGNHELDYGLAHLLIFNNCIKAPILCANIVVSTLGQMLFRPSMIFDINGIKMLVIGLIPEAFLKKIMSDEFCNTMLEYKDSYTAIREEIAAHKNEHIDLVVLMSHYGIEGDRNLAEGMPEDLHVDLILGGHSHIDMDEAEVINNIIMAQSSYGTTHIGRFDLEIAEEGGLKNWKWERIALTEDNSCFDNGVDELADRIVFNKKKRAGNDVLCNFERSLTHKSRLEETELGNLLSDIFLETYAPDLVILQSGSIRAKESGTKLDEKVFSTLYPFDDRFVIAEISGRELKAGFEYLFSLKPDGSVMNGTFQYSRGFRLVVDATDCWKKGCTIEELSLNGKEFEDEKIYRVGLTKNCAMSFLRYFGFVLEPEKMSLVSISTRSDIARWFLACTDVVKAPELGRFEMKNLVMPEQ